MGDLSSIILCIFFVSLPVAFVLFRYGVYRVVKHDNGYYSVKKFNWRKRKYEIFLPDFRDVRVWRENVTDE